MRRAINYGRLVEGEKAVSGEAGVGSDKSSRSLADAGAADETGTACIRAAYGVAASPGGLDGAEIRFEACLEVSRAGVFCALPAPYIGALMWEKFGLRSPFTVTAAVALLSIAPTWLYFKAPEPEPADLRKGDSY